MKKDVLHLRFRWPGAVALLAALSVGLVGCGDDPFAFNWNDAPDTVLLYSLARPELNLNSAFNFFQGLPVKVEGPVSTGAWDAAVDTRGSDLVLLTPGAFGVVGAARITTLVGMTLDDVTRAPSDTLLYVANDPVPVRLGTIYIVKTNRSRGSFGSSCSYYAKLEPLVIDVAGGALTFRYVANPVCNSLDLIPPE